MRRRVKVLILSTLILLLAGFCNHLAAQKNVELINSNDLINQGNELYDSGAYARACAFYEQVSRNDSNYALALFNDALSHAANDEDSLAVVLCDKGIGLSSEYIAKFYRLKGGALIDLKKYNDAIGVLQKAIVKFPNVYLLHFTLGLAYYHSQNYDSAVAAFERAINLNAFHASSHYYLGKTCLEQGRVIPALLSLQFYLMLEPVANRSFTAIQLIEKVVENKYDFNKATKVDPSKYGDEPFTDLELLVKSQAALNKEYKMRTKITYNVIKQCQLIYDKLTYVPNTSNFWMNTYVPFFVDMRNMKGKGGLFHPNEPKDYFEPYAYHIMQSVNDAALQEAFKKEKKKIEVFLEWQDHKMVAERHTRQIRVNGTPTKVACYYYADRLPQAMGPEDATGNQTGDWIFYHEKTGTVSAKGSFNNNSDRNSVWQWYYINGSLKERTAYRNGLKDGVAETWYENGATEAKYNYRNDSMEGKAWEYNSSGMPSSYGAFKGDKPDGKFTIYYNDGRPHYEVTFGEEGLEGETKEYYATGQLKFAAICKAGIKNGKATEYWPNGKIENEGTYRNDTAIEHWKYYYEDGTLQKELDYNKDGNITGPKIEYYRNGKKQEVTNHNTDGELDGKDIMYDEDGTEYGVFDYRNDTLLHYRYADKNGKVLSEKSLSGNVLYLENYYPDGVKYSEGQYANNMCQGEWKFYSDAGVLSKTENYVDGEVNGVVTTYYITDSSKDAAIYKVKDQVLYKNGTQDGYYKEYHKNDTLKSEGWYVDGQMEGDWYFYNLRGGVSSHLYYVNGELNGYADYYNPNGNLTEEDYYRLGYLDKISLYDSTGKKVVYIYNSDKGNGQYKSAYIGGQPKTERTYVAGKPDGHEKRYYYNGKLMAEGEYILNKCQGAYTTYYENGDLQSVFNFVNGEHYGPAVNYYKGKRIKEKLNYLGDEQNGAYTEYYENGRLKREAYFVEDEMDGPYSHYSPDSLLIFKSQFRNDIAKNYTYLGKDGKPVPPIPLEKGVNNLKAFYPNGNKSLECTYINGNLTGKRKEYYSNGNVSEEENYNMGDLSGLQKYYYINGKPRVEEYYYIGQKDGKCTYYYENGKVEHEENWILGIKQGTFTYYDNSGKQIKTAVYYNNDEVYEINK